MCVVSHIESGQYAAHWRLLSIWSVGTFTSRIFSNSVCPPSATHLLTNITTSVLNTTASVCCVSASANTNCICWRAVRSYSTEPKDFSTTFHLTNWHPWICQVSSVDRLVLAIQGGPVKSKPFPNYRNIVLNVDSGLLFWGHPVD